MHGIRLGGESLLQRRIKMIYWKRWKRVKTKYRNLQRIGIDKTKAWKGQIQGKAIGGYPIAPYFLGH